MFIKIILYKSTSSYPNHVRSLFNPKLGLHKIYTNLYVRPLCSASSAIGRYTSKLHIKRVGWFVTALLDKWLQIDILSGGFKPPCLLDNIYFYLCLYFIYTYISINIMAELKKLKVMYIIACIIVVYI